MGVLPMVPVSAGPASKGDAGSVPDRLPVLDRGVHAPSSGRACAMEAASWLAGERWSDHPSAVNRAIASVGRWVNDAVDDEERQCLWPLILASLHTAPVSRKVERRLRLLSREAGCRAVAIGRPLDAWFEVLDEHSRLTGHQPMRVPVSRIESLCDHLLEAGSR